MSDHIKSNDSCNRCMFNYFRYCRDKMKNSCSGCVMNATGKPGGCKCLTINPNTPCPYFEEEKDDDSFPKQKIQRYIR